MNYQVIKGLKCGHVGRPPKRTHLDDLIVLAKTMEVGDAVNLRSSDAQTFRVILAAIGFSCITDGYHASAEYGKTLAFKMKKIDFPVDDLTKNKYSGIGSPVEGESGSTQRCDESLGLKTMP